MFVTKVVIWKLRMLAASNQDVTCYIDCAIIWISGDYFRSLWGPFAGWAQSVSYNALFNCLSCQIYFSYMTKVYVMFLCYTTYA